MKPLPRATSTFSSALPAHRRPPSPTASESAIARIRTWFIRDLRERVIGQPEINTDGFLPYLPAIRDAFGKGAVHGQIIKTYSVVDSAAPSLGSLLAV
jgi:hypothetical protein